MSKKLFWSAALALCAFASRSAVAEGIEREFPVASGGTLVVAAQSANVAVEGGGEGVRVTIRRRDDDAAAIEEDYEISFEASDDLVRVSAHRRGGPLRRALSVAGPLVIEVTTPSEFDVNLKTSGGSVVVRDLTGATRVEASGGSLLFEDVDGPVDGRTSGGSIGLSRTSADVELATTGGSITVSEVGGHVRAKTTGGSIAVEHAKGVRAETTGGTIAIEHAEGRVSAKTTGGSISIGAADAVEASTFGGSIQLALTAQPSDDSRLTSTGGVINVHLPSDIGINVKARAIGGRVRIGEGLGFSGESSKTEVNGSLNDGGPELLLRARGGSINLQLAD